MATATTAALTVLSHSIDSGSVNTDTTEGEDMLLGWSRASEGFNLKIATGMYEYG